MSTQNEPDANAITALVALILWTGVCDASRLMIIVGYCVQKLLLQRKAIEGGWDNANIICGVDISTIHAAQGRERRIVIVGITRMGLNPQKHPWSAHNGSMSQPVEQKTLCILLATNHR